MTSMREDQLLGEKIVELFLLPATKHPIADRYDTTEGDKTAIGLGRTIRRLIEEAKTESFTTSTFVE